MQRHDVQQPKQALPWKRIALEVSYDILVGTDICAKKELG